MTTVRFSKTDIFLQNRFKFQTFLSPGLKQFKPWFQLQLGETSCLQNTLISGAPMSRDIIAERSTPYKLCLGHWCLVVISVNLHALLFIYDIQQ